MRDITTVLATLAVALGPGAFAQDTTIEVPQGSGMFPTIGQINCLEKLGSGRYCAATYECSGGVSGELWGDLANHDGRQAIGASSPVANGRDCVITVDGSAAVRWLTGYRPSGRTGELVGLTISADALRPVQRVVRSAGENGGSLLDYLLERYDTTLAELVDASCGHIQQGHDDHNRCMNSRLQGPLTASVYPDTELSRCVVESVEQWWAEEPTKTWPTSLDYLLSYPNMTLAVNAVTGGNPAIVRNCVDLADDLLTAIGVTYQEGLYVLSD